MPLPMPKNAEQAKKREAAAKRNPGPAPEQKIKLPEQPLNPTFQNKAPKPEPGNAGGSAQTPAGKVDVKPLSPAERGRFEKSFGMDLSAVTVHSGPGADAQCTARGAVAFIKGTNIIMSAKAGAPGSKGYDTLLGHELAHFVQQNGGGKAGGGDAEKDADKAGEKAAEGAPAPVEQKVAAGTEQKKEEEGEHKNPNTVKIPIGGSRSIEIVPPNKAGDWSLGVGDVVKFTEGIKEEGTKWWRKAIPTGFFGLSVDIGAGFTAEFKLGEVSLKGIKVNYKKATDTYELEGEIGTSMGLELGGFVSAGVSADVWIASAGVGLKAKLGLSKSHPLSASFRAGYSPSTNNFYFGGKLSLAALELEAKTAVSLYVYYDAWGISTYTKEWTLWERTLGKLSFGGVELDLAWSRAKGWKESSITPKPLEVQNFEGNIKNMYPKKS